MAKCAACGKFISPLGAASCSVCPSLYHKACIGVPEVALIATGWMCPECKIKMPKGGNTATPVKNACSEYLLDSSDSQDSAHVKSGYKTGTASVDSDADCNEMLLNATQPIGLGLEIRLFRDELREVRRELKEFRMEFSDMRTAIKGCNQRIDEFEKRLELLEKGTQSQQTGPSTSAELRVLEETIAQLQEDHNERDQELLLTDIEITNLPEVKGENPIHTVTVLATKLGVDLESKQIIYAERVGRPNDSNALSSIGRGRRMVVRLAQRSLRDELLNSARVRRGATTADMGMNIPPRRFYVNERLTKINRHLFYLAREAAREAKWKYTWTKRGRVYTRQGEGQPAHCIKVEADIARVFNDGKVGCK
ncbi:jg16571 [Pararge aegeria aegeria]|uniref:Jg16571 protein n=1 Tax=Pararge aegeria aegeria TaxID=348720 RepID=A0A8S4QFQ6_9NEOP|nr:jg16571 [Pararge aegeria aegeria]